MARYGKTARLAQVLHIEPEILAKALRDKSITEIDTPLGKCSILRSCEPKNGKHDGMDVATFMTICMYDETF